MAWKWATEQLKKKRPVTREYALEFMARVREQIVWEQLGSRLTLPLNVYEADIPF